MSGLYERMRAARRFTHEVDGKKYVILRPTEGDISRGSYHSGLAILEDFVIDWHLTEEDLLPGQGVPERVPFDKQVWIEYLNDHPEIWEPLAKRILDSYELHKQKEGEAKKK